MYNIIREIDYCARHAQYAPIKIYAGDEIDYSLNCAKCFNELAKDVNPRRSRKTANPFKKVIEDEQEPISPLSNS